MLKRMAIPAIKIAFLLKQTIDIKNIIIDDILKNWSTAKP